MAQGRQSAERAFHAELAVTRFLQLATTGARDDRRAEHLDLLPLAHPLSQAEHVMTASALRHAHGRWYAADPQLPEDARALTAAAYAAEPDTLEREHAFLRLQLTPGVPLHIAHPAFALTAALNFGGNSSTAKSARAKAQRRDSNGKFAFEGGLFRALVKMLGRLFSGIGRVVAEPADKKVFQVEITGDPDIPDGLYDFPAKKSAAIRARLKETIAQAQARVRGLTPTAKQLANAIDFDELMATRRDMPYGWEVDPNAPDDGNKHYISDDGYAATVTPERKFTLRRQPPQDTGLPVKELGEFDSWYGVQQAALADEEAYDAEVSAARGKAKPSAKLQQPATDAQKKLVQDLLSNPLVPQELKDKIQADLDTKGRKLTKAEVGQHIGDLKKIADSDAPTEKQINAIKRDVVAKGLPKAEADEILEKLPSMTKAEASKVIGRLKEMPDVEQPAEAAPEAPTPAPAAKIKKKLSKAQTKREVEDFFDTIGFASSMVEGNPNASKRTNDAARAVGDLVDDYLGDVDMKNEPYTPDRVQKTAEALQELQAALLADKNFQKKSTATYNMALKSTEAEVEVARITLDALGFIDGESAARNSGFPMLPESGPAIPGIAPGTQKLPDGVLVTPGIAKPDEATPVLPSDETAPSNLPSFQPGQAIPGIPLEQLPKPQGELLIPGDPSNPKPASLDLPTNTDSLAKELGFTKKRLQDAVSALAKKLLTNQDGSKPDALDSVLTRVLSGKGVPMWWNDLIAGTSGLLDELDPDDDEDVIDDIYVIDTIDVALESMEQLVADRLPKAPEQQAPTALDAPRYTDWAVKSGAYKIKNDKPYKPEGYTIQDSEDYTDDPAELAARFGEGEMADAMFDAVKKGLPTAKLRFSDGDEQVPIEALYDAMRLQGKDNVDELVGYAYDAGLGKRKNEDEIFKWRKELAKPATGDLDSIKGIGTKQLNEQTAVDGAAAAALLIQKYRDQEPTPQMREIADFLSKQTSDGTAKAMVKFMGWRESEDPAEREAFLGMMGILQVSDGGDGQVDENFLMAYGLHIGEFDFTLAEGALIGHDYQALVRSKAKVANGDEDPDSPESMAGAAYRLAALMSKPNKDILYRGIPMGVNSKALDQYITPGNTVALDLRPTSDELMVSQDYADIYIPEDGMASVVLAFPPGEADAIDMRNISPHSDESEFLAVGQYVVSRVEKEELGNGRTLYSVELKRVTPEQQDESLSENQVRELPEGSDMYLIAPNRPQDEDVDPADIAASYSDDVLRYELKAGIEDGTGLANLMDPEGNTRTVSVEAVRDALKIQGTDTEAVLDDIYSPKPAPAPAPAEAEAGGDIYTDAYQSFLDSTEPLLDEIEDTDPGLPTELIDQVSEISDLLGDITAIREELRDMFIDSEDYDASDIRAKFAELTEKYKQLLAEVDTARDLGADIFDDPDAWPQDEQDQTLADYQKIIDALDSKFGSGPATAPTAARPTSRVPQYETLGEQDRYLEGMDWALYGKGPRPEANPNWSDEENAAYEAGITRGEELYDQILQDISDNPADYPGNEEDNFSDWIDIGRDKIAGAEFREAMKATEDERFDDATATEEAPEIDGMRELDLSETAMQNDAFNASNETIGAAIAAKKAVDEGLAGAGLSDAGRDALERLGGTGEDNEDMLTETNALANNELTYDETTKVLEDQLALVDLIGSEDEGLKGFFKYTRDKLEATLAKRGLAKFAEPSVRNTDLSDFVDDLENDMPSMPAELSDQVGEIEDLYDDINAITEEVRDLLFEGEYEFARRKLDELAQKYEDMGDAVGTARDIGADAFDDPDEWPRDEQDAAINGWYDLAKKARSATDAPEPAADERPAETPGAPDAPEAPAAATSKFDDPTQVYDLSGFERVGEQQGSNPGGTFRGPDGTEVYVKEPKSDEHAANEALASALYEKLGIPAAKVRRGLHPETGEPVTFSEIIKSDDTTSFIEKLRTDEDFRKQVQSAFAIDAWLANWDVAGLTFDNIIVGEDGVGYRVDPGGALLFRAMGAPKGGALKKTSVPELTSLLDPAQNSQSAAVFNGMTDDEKRESAMRLNNLTRGDLRALVESYFNDVQADELVDTLWKRRQAVLEDLYGTSSLYDEDIYDADELLAAIKARVGENKAIASMEYTAGFPSGVRVFFADNSPEVMDRIDNLVARVDPYFDALERRNNGEATLIDQVILDGGATVNLADLSNPNEGFVVAVQGHNREIKADEFFGPNGNVMLTDWLSEKADVFAENDKFMLGMWYDKANDEVVLDVVEVFGADEREAAVAAGIERNQQAIWDIAAEDIVETGGTGDRAEQEEADGVGEEQGQPGDTAPEPQDGEPGGDPGVVDDGDSELPGSDQGPETLDEVEDESTRATTAPKDIISIARIKATYPNHVVLDNNDIVVDQHELDGYTYETVVRRNTGAGGDNETYTVYARRVDNKTGEVTVLDFKNRSHSDKALNNQIEIMRKRLRGLNVASAQTRARFNKQKPVKNAPKPKQLGDMDDLEISEAAAKLRNDGPGLTDEAKLGGLIQVAAQLNDTPENREAFIDALADEDETFGSREAIGAVFDAVQAGDESLLQDLRKVTHLSQNGVELDSGMRVSWTDPKTGNVRVGTVVKRASTLDSRAYKFTDYVYVRFDDNKGKYVHRVSDRLVALDGNDKPIGSTGDTAPAETTAPSATPVETPAAPEAEASTPEVKDTMFKQVQDYVAMVNTGFDGSDMTTNFELNSKIKEFIDKVLLAIRNKTGEVFTSQNLKDKGLFSESAGTPYQELTLPAMSKPSALHLKLKPIKDAQELEDRTASGEFTRAELKDGTNIIPGSILRYGDEYWQVTRSSDVKDGKYSGAFMMYHGVRVGGTGGEEALQSKVTMSLPITGMVQQIFTPTEKVADDYYIRNLSAPPLEEARLLEGGEAPITAPDAFVVNAIAKNSSDKDLMKTLNAYDASDVNVVGMDNYPFDWTGITAVVPGSVVLRHDGSAGIVSQAPISTFGDKNNLVRVTWLSGPAAGREELTMSSTIRSTGRLYTYESAKTLYNVTLDSDKFEELVSERGDFGRATAAAEFAAKEAAIASAKKLLSAGEKGPGKKPASSGEADWTQSADPAAMSMAGALEDVFVNRNADGQVTLVDAGDVEDQQITVQAVNVDNSRDATLLRFKLTSWAGDRFVELVMNGQVPSVQMPTGGDGLKVLRFNRSQTDDDLRHNTGTPLMPTGGGFIDVDKNQKGYTYVLPLMDDNNNKIGEVRLHRAVAGLDEPNFVFDNGEFHENQAKTPLAYHNQVQVLLDGQADAATVERALRALAIEDVTPATPESIKILKENKLIALLNNKANGAYNLSGDGRDQALAEIEKEWGITADDLEYRKLHDGRLEILAPKEFGEKMAEHLDVTRLQHSGSVMLEGSNSYGEALGKLVEKTYLASTVERYGVGILVAGMSSASDIYRIGAEYLFMTPNKTNDKAPSYNPGSWGYSEQTFSMYFDPTEVFRRLDWYYNNMDQYGSRFDVDPLTHLKESGNGGELMLKHGVNLSMLLALHANSGSLENAIQYLKSRGIASIDGVPIEEILGGK